MPERPPDLPDFDRPPLVEVAIGLQFEAVPQMRQGHVGLFWAQIRDEYPNTRDLPPLPSGREDLEGDGPVFTFQVSDVPDLHRAWFLSEDETTLVQVQSDRLVHNWREVRGEPYPRFETIYATFAERLRQFESVLRDSHVPALTAQQVEVTYINWIGADSLADFFVPAQPLSLELQGIAERADDEAMTLRFSVTADDGPIGRLYVQAGPGLRRSPQIAVPGSAPERGFLMSLSFKAPVPVTAATYDLEDLMYRGRNAIVRVFTALTKPSWHKTWGRTQ